MSESKKPLELDLKFACLGDVYCWEFEEERGDNSHIVDDELVTFVEKSAYLKAIEALREASDEFDDHLAETEANYTQGSWLNDKGIAFVAGARWQHKQDQLKTQSLEAEIQRLKDKYESKYLGRP